MALFLVKRKEGKIKFLLQQNLKEMIYSLKNLFRKDKTYNVRESDEFFPCKVGEEVLLYSKSGRYKVVATSEDSFIVTCKRWRRTREEEFRTQKHLWSDFKAKVN